MEVVEFFENIDELLNDFLMGLGYLGPLISSILIILEGTLAFLPLFVFVTINILVLGTVLGGIVSWICTVMGSYIAFTLFRLGFSNFVQKRAKKSKTLKKFMQNIDKIKFSQLVFIISIPFAPSFFINVGAGLSHINKRKYLYALLIGKIGVVIFSGFLGINLVDCLTNPSSIIKVVVVLVAVYILSRYVNKKFSLDERF